MVRKRKRSSKEALEFSDAKRRREERKDPCLNYPLLSLYYSTVSTLRDYILSRFPKSSRSRKQRVKSVAQWPSSGATVNGRGMDYPTVERSGCLSPKVNGLSKLLDTTIIGYGLETRASSVFQPRRNLDALSQKLHSSLQSTAGKGDVTQAELVDFAVGHLFYGAYRNTRRPPHVLCNGYEIPLHAQCRMVDDAVGSNGLDCTSSKTNASVMSSAVWQDLLKLLGQDGDKVMLDLIMNCGVFQLAEVGIDNLIQLSGVSLSELQMLPRDFKSVKPSSSVSAITLPAPGKPSSSQVRNPSDITFVRSRMLYARPALNAEGDVSFGLRRIHVLNRYPDYRDAEHVVHVMKHIFPRQFKLHNVFSCTADSKETAHTFKDYTLREQEIHDAQRKAQMKAQGRQVKTCHLPKRLRGSLPLLVAGLLKLHARCSYAELLKYYCPVEWIDCQVMGQKHDTEDPPKVRICPEIVRGKDIVESATLSSSVSAFCRAVLAKIIPKGFWGNGVGGQENHERIMRLVDKFIVCRRYENVTLHAACQGLKVSAILWLAPDKARSDSKVSKFDLIKRQKILHEFVYYVFDSILIPLLQSHFHITESNTDKNRLFFFRHDVWKVMTEPSLSELQISMFEEAGRERITKSDSRSALAFSQMRLVPKGAGFRPIMNLRRRALTIQNGKKVLGKAINFQLQHVYSMLNYQKGQQPGSLGASMFSIGEIHSRLKAFRSTLQKIHKSGLKLYFAKVDVKSSFDTIPQREMIRVIERLCNDDQYLVSRHAEIRACDPHGYRRGALSSTSKPSRRFLTTAQASDNRKFFSELVNSSLAVGKKKTVFVESGARVVEDNVKLMRLLSEHVRHNKVKIGKRYYRQKQGIPQGSILSSILCSFFYGDFEAKCLDFLNSTGCLLMRLIDDFLLITINRQKAAAFLQLMHDGSDEYGISVRPEKSLTNFRCEINGVEIRQLREGKEFPYCGITIDTNSLETSKDRNRQKRSGKRAGCDETFIWLTRVAIGDALTVESFKATGEAFYRKTMTALKIQLHAVFTDTELNSPNKVLHTLYQSFYESAMKAYRYLRSLGSRRQIEVCLLIKTINDLMSLAFVLISSRHQGKKEAGYECAVSKKQIRWLMATAFRHVLGSKQSRHVAINSWLHSQAQAATPRNAREARKLRKVAQAGNALYHGYRY